MANGWLDLVQKLQKDTDKIEIWAFGDKCKYTVGVVQKEERKVLEQKDDFTEREDARLYIYDLIAKYTGLGWVRDGKIIGKSW